MPALRAGPPVASLCVPLLPCVLCDGFFFVASVTRRCARVMSGFDAVRNLGLKAARRLQAVPKPFVRMMRRQARAEEHRAFRRDAEEIEATLAGLAQGKGPIIVGPWLAEVGYEVLYWIPFLRWFQDAHGIPSDRFVVVSRGGMESAYAGIAGRYVDLFDLMTPSDFADRNHQRRAQAE